MNVRKLVTKGTAISLSTGPRIKPKSLTFWSIALPLGFSVAPLPPIVNHNNIKYL